MPRGSFVQAVFLEIQGFASDRDSFGTFWRKGQSSSRRQIRCTILAKACREMGRWCNSPNRNFEYQTPMSQRNPAYLPP
jgi:hypothetical protein